MITPPARTVCGLLIGATLAATAYGAAASLGGVSAAQFSAGNAVVGACDSDGVGMSYTTSAGIVQQVTVTGVAAGCVNGALRVVLANSSGSSIGAGGPVTVAASSVAVTLSPQPTASAVAAANVSITGP